MEFAESGEIVRMYVFQRSIYLRIAEIYFNKFLLNIERRKFGSNIKINCHKIKSKIITESFWLKN